MKTLKLKVPTYNANYFPREVEEGTKPEFGKPFVPVVIHSADGVRVVLGTHMYLDCDKPDIAIERQPNGWAIFLHPVGGGDPCGYVFFLDDGRSYLRKETTVGDNPGIQVVEPGEDIPGINPDEKLPLTRRELASMRAALEYWKEELREGKEWVHESLFFRKCTPLSEAEIDQLAKRLERAKAVE